MTQQRMQDHDRRIARARLSLEGLSLGDAFGECFFERGMQMWLAHRVLPDRPWFYTDDTMMAWSIVDVLDAHGRIDQEELGRCFAERFRRQPQRGYGRGAVELLLRIQRGESWQRASGELFGGQGSLGNGGAMRVAPVGAYFADDLDRVVHEARASAVVTHSHPEGQAGAIALAVAAAAACRHREQPDEAESPLEVALKWTPDGEVREGIAKAITISPDTAVEVAAVALGSGQKILASDTVPFALWCAAGHLDSFEDALWTTAQGFGDIDTTCAMVGGMVALAVGMEGIPREWIRRREPLEE